MDVHGLGIDGDLVWEMAAPPEHGCVRRWWLIRSHRGIHGGQH
jgi:hypothetical protein